MLIISLGSECGIVLLSTVRSLPLADIKALKIPDRAWMYENLGFLIDKHIINVGVTRCQYGLVIVGKTNKQFVIHAVLKFIF